MQEWAYVGNVRNISLLTSPFLIVTSEFFLSLKISTMTDYNNDLTHTWNFLSRFPDLRCIYSKDQDKSYILKGNTRAFGDASNKSVWKAEGYKPHVNVVTLYRRNYCAIISIFISLITWESTSNPHISHLHTPNSKSDLQYLWKINDGMVHRECQG